MSKRTPGYMLPTTSEAIKSSIMDEEFKQRRGKTSKGRKYAGSPACGRSSRRLTLEENAAKRNMSGRPTLPPRDDQNNREHQHAKSTLKVPDNDWNSYISDHIDREYPSASRSPEFPDENLKYTLTDQYNRRYHLAKSTLESPGDNLNPSHSDHYKREYQYRSCLLESSDDDWDILEPPCPQMPRTEYELSNALSRLKLSPTRDYELSYTTYDKGSTLGVKDNRSSHPASGVGFTLGTKDNWLSDTTRGRRNLDVQVNEKLGRLLFTERNPDPYKTFVEDESGHRPRSPVRREPLISGSSNGVDYLYKNIRDSATSVSLLHDNHRSTSWTNIDLQISASSVHNDSLPSTSSVRLSETSLEDDNLRSLSQTKTEIRRLLSYDAKDKEKKQEKPPMHPLYKKKLRKPDSATIKTSNNSKEYEPSHITCDKGSTFGAKDYRLSHSTSGEGSTLGANDFQVNKNAERLIFTEKNQDASKHFVEGESSHRTISPVRREPLIPGSSNDEYYSYRNTRDSATSASMLHENQRSPSQTSTDFRRSLSYDAKDEEEKQEKTPVHPHSKRKLRKPKKLTNLELCDNLLFYQGKIKSKPAPGYTITEMLKWKGDYGMLEKHHLYMSWLFPIHESKGLNKDAQVLTDYEAKEIQKDKAAHERVLEAYRMMLDFYGMILINERDGTLLRADNYIERYDNINRFRHNLSRITRIIKSMGELGYQRLQAPLVNFLYAESVIERKLPNFRQSTFDHWIIAISNGDERMKMYRLVHGFTDEIENEFEENVIADVRVIRFVERDNIAAHAFEKRTIYTSTNSLEDSEFNKTGTKIKYDEMGKQDQTVDKRIKESSTGNKRDKSNCRGKSDPVRSIEVRTNINGNTSRLPKRTSPTTLSDNGTKPKGRKCPSQALHTLPSQTFCDVTQEGSVNNLSHVEINDYKHGDLREVGLSSDECKDEDLSHVEIKCYKHGDLREVGLSSDEIIDIDDTYQCDNLRFYRNEIHSRPSQGFTIETILQHCGDYEFLDKYYPCFVKWLFPIPIFPSKNTQALLPHEIKALLNDKDLSGRVSRVLVLALDYYGIKIVDQRTGELKKTKNWTSRWKILNMNKEHEFKHITRVLVSLGALGYKRYQVPLIEIFIKNKDDITEFDWNSVRHWIENVNDEGQQQALFEKYVKKIFSQKTLDACNAQTKHEQHSGYDNTIEHLGTIGT